MTLEESIDVNNASLPQDESIGNNELLTDEIEDQGKVNASQLDQFSDDDLEDEELLTAGLDEGEEVPMDKVEEIVSPIKPALVADDDSIDDENLLSD